MISFSELLIESQEINLSIKAYKTLSSAAKRAIDEWEAMNWHKGVLSTEIKTTGPIAQELDIAFEPIRQLLRQKYGDSVKLYRGLYIRRGDTYKDWENSVLTSWTIDRNVAEYFAGLRYSGPTVHKQFKGLSKLFKVHTDKQIDDAVAFYDKNGWVKFGGYSYIRSKSNPRYYNIYRGMEFQTDGDHGKLGDALRYDQSQSVELNQPTLQNAKILSQQIDIDRIVWITNRLNCREFIVKN